MTLDELKWITDLFATCNVSRSAENLFVSQSALSQFIKRMEKQLGFQIFERSNKGLKPTEKGLLFSETAEKIVRLYTEFEMNVELMDHQDLKDIKIGMAPYMASICAVDLTSELSKAFSQIRFSVYDSYSADLVRALRNNDINMLVVSLSEESDEFYKIPFGDISSVIYLRKGSEAERYSYEEKGIRYLDPKYLADEPFSITHQGQSSRILTERLLREAGIAPKIAFETRHISNLYKYADTGLASAISMLTGEMSERDRENHLIYRIPETYEHAVIHWQILTQKNMAKHIHPKIYEIVKKTILDSRTAI